MATPLSEDDLILINAYLDGELSPKERKALELRLSREPALQAELESLQMTVALLNMAERLPVPRNFTLDPAVYGKPARPRFWESLRLAGLPRMVTAGVMLLFLLFCVGAVILAGRGGLGAAAPAAPANLAQAPAEQPQIESFAVETLSVEKTTAEELAATEDVEAQALQTAPAPEQPESATLEAELDRSAEAAGAAPAAEQAALPTPTLAPAPTQVGEVGEQADDLAYPEAVNTQAAATPGELPTVIAPTEMPPTETTGLAAPLLVLGAVLLIALAVLGVILLLRRRTP